MMRDDDIEERSRTVSSEPRSWMLVARWRDARNICCGWKA